MATRGEGYLYSFMATLAYPKLVEHAVEDYETEEEQRRYLDQLVASERDTLRSIETQFENMQEQRRYLDTSALEQLLVDVSVDQARVASASAAQAGTLPEGLIGSLRAATTLLEASTAMSRVEGQLSEQQVQTAISELQRAGLDAASLDQVFGPGAYKRADPGAFALTAGERTVVEGLEALQQAGPEGVKGLAEGQAEIDRRKSTTAPVGSSFDTLEDAYQEALAALDNGLLTPEDFKSEEDYKVAKEVYSEAKAKGAYRNEEQLFFDRSLLSSRSRLAELEARAQELASPAGMTRQQAIDRKILERQGYDFNKPFLQYQKSPYYNVLVEADDYYKAALDAARSLADLGEGYKSAGGQVNVVRPVNDQQKTAGELVDLLVKAEGVKPLNVKRFERQLRKTYKGAELQDALAFAVAYNRGLVENIDTPSKAETQLKLLKDARRREEDAKEISQDAERVVADAREGVALEEQAIITDAGQQLNLARAQERAMNAYQRARAAELTIPQAEQVRDRVLMDAGVIPTPAPTEPAPVAPPQAAAPEPAPAPEPEAPQQGSDAALVAALEDPSRTETQLGHIRAELQRRGVATEAETEEEEDQEAQDAKLLQQYAP